ncbi:hypothetical protein ACHQM5_024602 [Ranunculus cassubicifolius]
MRKLFWFKSSSSNTVSSNTFSSPLGDGKVSREETQVPGLRRSRSLSSSSFQSGALEESKFFSCDTWHFLIVKAIFSSPLIILFGKTSRLTLMELM